MGQITISSVNSTYIIGDSDNYQNFYEDTVRKTGAYVDGSVSLIYYNSFYWFTVPSVLKNPNIKITSCKISGRKKWMKTIDTSQSKWTEKTYNGVSCKYYIIENISSNYADVLIGANCQSITGKGPGSYGLQSFTANNVNDGELFEANVPEFEDYHPYDSFVLRVAGNRTAQGGTYYYGALDKQLTLTYTYADKRPVLKVSSYTKDIATTHDNTISWKYTSELSNAQASVVVEYSTNNQASWATLATVTGDETSYVIEADTMSAGDVYIRLKATDTEGNVGEYTTPIKISYHIPKPVVEINDWTVESLNKRATLPITWTYSSEDNYKQASWKISWKLGSGSWTDITGTTEQNYTFASQSFGVGTITLKLQVTDTHGLVSDAVQKTFTVYKQTPVVTCGYPSKVTINNSNRIIYTWSFTEEINIGQKAYDLQWSSDNELTWNSVSGTTNQYHEFSSSTFPTGTIIWKVRAKDNDDTWSEYSKTYFTAIGQTSAPVITWVTNKSIPTVTWTVSSQDCYEVRLLDSNNKYLYKSQLKMGADVRSFTIPVMLENGNYSVEVRALNQYGVYTEWSSYSFIINLESPSAPSNVFVALDNDYSVMISGTAVAGTTTYVVRKDLATNEIKVIDRFIGNTVKDYSAGFDKAYAYTLRSYGGSDTAGFSDGEWLSIRIPLQDHAVLHNNSDKTQFVNLSKSHDEWNVSRNDSFNRTYHFTIGRDFPVVERTDWNTSTRTFNAWASDEDLELLRAMHNSDVYYRAEGEAFLADMVISEGDKYVSGGKLVNIKVTRIEENERTVL